MTLGEQVARSNARILESQMTKAEVLAYYADRGPLPARRFRVEGSLGRSRLLSNADRTVGGEPQPSISEKTVRKYGGKIVEVFTASDWWREKAKGLRACDKCGVEADAPCVKKAKPIVGGTRRVPILVRPHLIRYEVPLDGYVIKAFERMAGSMLTVDILDSMIAVADKTKKKIRAAIARLLADGSIRKAKGGYMLAVAPPVEVAAA